jgi:hypothetical protein
VRKPLRIRCALLGTKAWVVGFAADASWLVYFTALRKAPVAVVQSVAESGVAVPALFAGARPTECPRPRRTGGDGTAVLGLGLLGLSLAGSHPSERMRSALAAAVWLGVPLIVGYAGRSYSRTASSKATRW